MLFPIVVLLGLNGLVVGILNAHDHFTIPALAPLVWNLVIIAGLVGLRRCSRAATSSTPTRSACSRARPCSSLMLPAAAAPARLPAARSRSTFRHDPRVRQVLKLMLPVSLGLGLINFNLLINSTIGMLVSEEAPRAIDAAFRIYMLPQGMFSVAVATVLFPTLSRLATRRDLAGLRALIGNGMRQIALLLIPSAAAFAALAEPITRLVYERGEFGAASTEQVSEALFWFSFSLPFAGITPAAHAHVLLAPAPVAADRSSRSGRCAVNAVVSLALYKPLGIAGIVIGTTVSQPRADARSRRAACARELGGLEVARTLTGGGDHARRRRAARRGRVRGVVRPRRAARPVAARRSSSSVGVALALGGLRRTPRCCCAAACPRRARSSTCSRRRVSRPSAS